MDNQIDTSTGKYERMARQLAERVAALPPLYREVFVLRELEGQTGPEAARTLGITVEACKMRLHRARALVQEGLAREA